MPPLPDDASLRIAVLQVERAVTLDTCLLIRWLARKAKRVDLYLRRAPIQDAAAELLLAEPNVVVRDLDKMGPTLAETRHAIALESYHLALGIEKNGLLWAAAIAEACGGIPYWYYSLEIRVEDPSSLQDDVNFRQLRLQEVAAHRNAALTITPTEFHYLALISANQALAPEAFAGLHKFGGNVTYLSIGGAGLSHWPRSDDAYRILEPYIASASRDASNRRSEHMRSVENKVSASNSPTFLSVVIPTFNRADLLRKALLSLTHQTYTPSRFEVIVIDNGSTDHTAEVCASIAPCLPQFRMIKDDRPGLLVGRHRGLEAACGTIIVYGDDDMEASATWLAGVADAFAVDPSIALVGGPIFPNFEEIPPAWIESLVEKTPYGWVLPAYSLSYFGNEIREINPGHVYGCNFSIRKEMLIRIGGFHPDCMPSDLVRYMGDGETGISRSIGNFGGRALYHPRAAVRHFVSRGRLTSEYIRKRYYGEGVSQSYRVIRQHRGLSSIRETDKPPLLPPSAPPIRQLQYLAMRDGFSYHQEATRDDPRLLAWVMRDSYLNAYDINEDADHKAGGRV